MPRVIAIMNQKGGVGKTTTTLNLGAALAAHGKRVLLVDLDPQANLTMGVGRRAADLSESVYELLTNPKVETEKLVIKTQWEGLHLIPSHIDLSGAELEMVTMIGRETRLSKALDSIRNNYDYVIIDCLPSLSLLTVNAMATANEVFVPLQAHPFALEGLGKLFEVVGMIREAMNPTLKVSGVLVTMFDGRTNVSKVTLEMLRGDDRLREHIFTTTVKQNIKVAESQKEGVPVIFFDPSCHAAKAYQALGEEVLEMENGVLASHCADNITARQKSVGEKLTFTSDLIAPQNKPQPAASTARQEVAPVIPAASVVHVSSVTALVNGGSEIPAENSEEESEVTAEPVLETARQELAKPELPPVPKTDVPSVAEILAEATAPEKIPETAPLPIIEVAPAVEVSAPQASPPVIVPEPIQPAAVAVAQGSPSVPQLQLDDSRAESESIHPAMGSVFVIPANADAVAVAQAAQSGIELRIVAPMPAKENVAVGADILDEDYRPRLQLKPSTLKIPLPPASSSGG